MSNFNGRNYTNLRGLNLDARNGAIRFVTPTTAPTTTSGERLVYVNSSNQLIYDDGSSATALGASGVVSSFSLNDAYDDGSTITVDASSVTLSANISSTALQITQSGSGDDIQGTSDTWAVTKAGAAVFTAIAMADNELITFGTGSDATIGWNGTLLNVAGATDFDNAVTTQSTVGVGTVLTVTGGAASDAIIVTAGDFLMSDGSAAIIDADNANSFTVTNNTATTDSATTGGIVEFQSTSLTTGVLLNLELTEAQLNGGQYLRAYDVTGTEDVFTLNENGAISILGNTSGTDSVTVTAGDLTLVSGHLEMTVGDITLADGSVNITDADSAVSFQVTNNTITTTAAMVDFDSTSISTGALVRMDANTTAHDGEILELISAGDATATPTGLSITIPDVTTGAATGIDLVMAGLTTTGFGVKVTMDAITTGDMLYLDNGGGTMTGDGKFINCNDDNTSVFSVAVNGLTTIAGNASGTDALVVTAGDVTVTSGMVTVAAGGVQSAAVARTANATAGSGTSTVSDGESYITVTSSSANNVIVLPTPTPGNIVWLFVGANGYELRSDTPASVAINAGTGADAESAVGANVLVRAVCTSATTWVCSTFSTDGTEAKLEAAA